MLTFYSSVAWALQNELNAWDVSKMTLDEIAEHHNLVDHFTINVDESSMGANEGELHILGSQGRRRHKKNVVDCRESISIVRVDSAANVDGPCFYLAKGKEIELDSFKKLDSYGKVPEDLV